jgi:hypothetical protein
MPCPPTREPTPAPTSEPQCGTTIAYIYGFQSANGSITYSFEMGQNSGFSLFEFNAFNTPDTFSVSYENNEVFNSGRTQGYNSTVINFNGTSSLLTVTVTTNGEGSGAVTDKLTFIVHCPGDIIPTLTQESTNPGECYDANMIVNVLSDNKVEQKRVGDLQRNDMVQVFKNDGTTDFERVIYTYDHDGEKGKVVRMHFENIVTGEKGHVAITRNHVIYTSETPVFENGNGKSAKYVKKGHYLFGANNAVLKVVDIDSYATEIISIQTHSRTLVVNNVYTHTYNFGKFFGFIETIGQRLFDIFLPGNVGQSFLRYISVPFTKHGMPIVESMYNKFAQYSN